MYEITSLGLINNLNNMKNYIRALWKLHYGLYIYMKFTLLTGQLEI
jgi:hypothetical protein